MAPFTRCFYATLPVAPYVIIRCAHAHSIKARVAHGAQQTNISKRGLRRALLSTPSETEHCMKSQVIAFLNSKNLGLVGACLTGAVLAATVFFSF